VLVLDDLSGGGAPSLSEVAAALARFKHSGKQVVAWGSSYSQRQYFLAAHADEVYLHPFGYLEVRGFGGNGLYFKDALDKLGVTVHGFQAGKYKSAIEPLTRSSPSPEALEANQSWLDDAWKTWSTDVERVRKLPAGSINRLIDEAPQRLAAVKGDAAQLALTEKLVDGLKTRDEFRALMIERGAPIDDKKGTFRQVPLGAYLAHVKEKSGDAVGVVVAAGEIVDDRAPQGVVSGREVAELVRRAREDDSIKALVLRVDSPGGSAFGSELIRREIELTRQSGKPVIVSMGDVAASGGYWISMSADEIFADPTTITGSIGVFGVVPTVEKSLEKLGVGTGGAATTWLAGASDPFRPMDPRLMEMIQVSIEHVYRRFLAGVAEGRNSTPEKIDEIAQGRVWTGNQAKERGLVDTLGGINDALAAAARRGKLGDTFRVAYIEREPRGFDRWLGLLFGRVAIAIKEQFGATVPFGLATAVPPQAKRDLHVLEQARSDPGRVFVHCLCEAP
jgi:protease-4